MMPKQGPCNIKLHRWEAYTDHDDGGPDHYTPAHETRGMADYADAAELILAADGLRMVEAVIEHGRWDSRYL